MKADVADDKAESDTVKADVADDKAESDTVKVDVAVDKADDSVSVSKEIANSIPTTTEKVSLFKEKLVSIMSEMDSKDKQLETETHSNVDKVETDVKNEELRVQAARKSLSTLYDEMTSLNATVQDHYNTLLSDSTYVQSLDKMRPGFMKSLEKLTSRIDGIKNLVDNKIINDEYKDEMLSLLNGIRFNTHNISGYVATAFINHYNKYKSRIQGDNTKYLSSVSELSNLSSQYKSQQKKTARLERERERLESILLKLKTTLKTSKKTQSEFEGMFKQILALFDKNAKSRC